jgi:hypothetical protein
MEIATAVPGTVKASFNLPRHVKELGELPPGPWKDEPSKIQWVDQATGYPCLIVRGGGGALCGYAGVYPGHPYHKVNYDSVDVEVHGGLTFSAPCSHSNDESQGVCHIPEPGTSDDVWWLGFDCAHFGDLMPGMLNILRSTERDVYRDVRYVTAEVTGLAAQLLVLGAAEQAVARL